MKTLRVALAAAFLVAAGATAAGAEPRPPGACKLRMEPWIATDIDQVPYIGKPYLECYY